MVCARNERTVLSHMAKCSPKHIVSLLHSFVSQDCLVFVFPELLPIDFWSVTTPEVAFWIISQIVQGAYELHQQRIVHLGNNNRLYDIILTQRVDIKPDNIMMDSSG